jgi:hypothetical protein
MGRFLSPDWASDPTAVPYASYANPQSLNLYNYMRNNPLGGVDADGHCCEADFDSFQTPEQKNWNPNTDFDRQFVKTLAKFTVGGLAIAATGGAAGAIGEGIEAASAAGDLSLGTGLKIGMGVGGVATVAGAATGTDTEDAVSHVNAVTNPVAGAVALATNSATTGSNAGDAVTVGKALGNLATGKAIENPAEAASSLGGAIDAVKGVANSVGSYFSTPQPPPAPKPPSTPGCSVAEEHYG